eukprot:scpid95236/ scgid34700/ 
MQTHTASSPTIKRKARCWRQRSAMLIQKRTGRHTDSKEHGRIYTAVHTHTLRAEQLIHANKQQKQQQNENNTRAIEHIHTRAPLSHHTRKRFKRFVPMPNGTHHRRRPWPAKHNTHMCAHRKRNTETRKVHSSNAHTIASDNRRTQRCELSSVLTDRQGNKHAARTDSVHSERFQRDFQPSRQHLSVRTEPTALSTPDKKVTLADVVYSRVLTEVGTCIQHTVSTLQHKGVHVLRGRVKPVGPLG